MIKVCKPVEVTENVTHCLGTKEFKMCHTSAEIYTDEACGTGDTFEAAKVDLAAELQKLVDGKLKVIVGRSQSATQYTSIWEYIGRAFMSCNPGQEY